MKARALLKDYGLHDHGVLEKNLNRFMAHIGQFVVFKRFRSPTVCSDCAVWPTGIRFELVPVPASAATSPRSGSGSKATP